MLKFTKALSRDVINSVIVEENFQPMVHMGNIKNIFFDKNMLEENKYCRQDIIIKLECAQNNLPKGLFLKIYYGFRSIETQLEQWNKRFEETKQNNNGVSLEELERLTRLKVADPRNGKYGPHQTGGAIDVTLCNSEGIELNMGTGYAEFNENTRTYPLKNDKLLINESELNNRIILFNAITSAGLFNYPMEWWHYSFGDKAWAAYSGFNKCCYGCVNEKIKFLR